LETRRLHTLAREELLDGFTVHAQDASDAHRIEAAVVNETADRLGMYAELVGDLANADEAIRLFRR
jgi:hypothetical protein